ncbi:MAG: hypothetical protein J6X66_09465, partial [Lachnospiraceae bacterium]|nr:hypothetical protein [Lachnospiraceae bacterium]
IEDNRLIAEQKAAEEAAKAAQSEQPPEKAADKGNEAEQGGRDENAEQAPGEGEEKLPEIVVPEYDPKKKITESTKAENTSSDKTE